MITPTEVYLAKVRTTLRLQTTAFDDEITDYIMACREDLVQLGVLENKVTDEADGLVLGAVRAYVRWRFSSDAVLAERSKSDYYDMRDEMRLRYDYTEEVAT